MIAAEKIVSLLDEMQDRIRAKPWKNMNRQGMLYNISATISEVEELQRLLLAISAEYENERLEDTPDITGAAKGCSELIALLKRNKELEGGKTAAAGNDIYALKGNVEEKEIYSSLQQQALDLILRTRYLADRINIYERKRHVRPHEGRSAKRNVLELLEDKEKELESLRKKYSDLRSKAHMGLVEEESIADLEKEYNETLRKEDAEFLSVTGTLEAFGKDIEEFNSKYLKVKEAVSKLEELGALQAERASGLIKSLRKENDYARKLVLDIENETIRLRSAYSKELLSLEEAKESARHGAYEKFRQQLFKLRKENSEKELVITELRKIAKRWEDKVGLLSKKLADFEKEKAQGVIRETRRALEKEKKKVKKTVRKRKKKSK
jgi:hypothetical protein